MADPAACRALGVELRLSSARPHLDAAPGVYVVGHSSLLVRGVSGGILFDPVHGGRLAGDDAIPLQSLAAQASAVALTHSHFDHYHVPSLLRLGELPLYVPHVPRASITCEDMFARMADFGAMVSVAEWGSTWETGDCSVRVLPFVGEQFLTSETHPEAQLLAPARRVTLSVADLPDLVRACGARTVVLYGQFQFGRGQPIVAPALCEAAEHVLREAGVQAQVPRLTVGQGITPAGEVTELPPGAADR